MCVSSNTLYKILNELIKTSKRPMLTITSYTNRMDCGGGNLMKDSY